MMTMSRIMMTFRMMVTMVMMMRMTRPGRGEQQRAATS